MSQITDHLINCIEIDLGVRDEGEQEELLVEMGINMYLYDEEGLVSINDGKLISYVTENHINLPGGSLLEAICNDIQWGLIEQYLKLQVEDWFSRKRMRENEDENLPEPKKSKHQ